MEEESGARGNGGGPSGGDAGRPSLPVSQPSATKVPLHSVPLEQLMEAAV